ncbi:Aristolochene synthase in complex with 12,13 Difluorofarnesyl diphosphate [Favolaschia claudopus]|uniref:Aristolochene synthase in complex with 12,13 Difluorofarnesyl diphosphate n=1 Tax=Favolaschia claudopus TaxID=2862362 RepID=A0AAW0D4E7_9AGAR
MTMKQLTDAGQKSEQDELKCAVLPSWIAGLPPTIFIPKVHPMRKEITQDVNVFFLAHWPFPNEKARKKFVDSDFCYGLCATWPESVDDRMNHACRLFTLLFLIDDLLDDMSLEGGRAFNNGLLSLMQGHRMPIRENPIESMSYDIWNELHASDPVLSMNILVALGPFMESQTDALRAQENIGLKALITATGLYCTRLAIPTTDLAVTEPLDDIYMKHLIYGNDAWSYDKELKTAQETCGTALDVQAFSSISTLMNASGMTARSAKRVLVFLQREMELLFGEVAEAVLTRRDTPELQSYIKMLEFQMSGSELWATETLRYYDYTAY